MIAAAPAEGALATEYCSGCGIDLTRFNRGDYCRPGDPVQLCKGCDAALTEWANREEEQ